MSSRVKTLTHQDSECHKVVLKVVLSYDTIVKSCKNIDTTNINTAKKRKNERKYLIKVVESLRYLAKQGIPLQGHDGYDNFTHFFYYAAKMTIKLAALANRECKKYTR